MKHFSDHTEDLQNENQSSKLIELCRIMCKSVFLKDINDNNRYEFKAFLWIIKKMSMCPSPSHENHKKFYFMDIENT